MDKMVEELEKDVEDVANTTKMNPIFAQNPYTNRKVLENIDNAKPLEVVEQSSNSNCSRHSVALKRGNSTRYSNFYTEE